MTPRACVTTVCYALLALLLSSILAFGSLAHAMLPHSHSANEAVTSLLHSALRHEDKQLIDLVPQAPPFLAVVVASIIVALYAPLFLKQLLLIRAPALMPLRRGILPYRRFG